MKSILRQCAPTLTGVKTGLLVKFDRSVSDEVLSFLSSTGPDLETKRLRDSDSVLVLFYSRKLLSRVLNCCEVRSFLVSRGYPEDYTVESALDILADRMGREDVPHEIGVFLGYPLCDVIGFMDNEGRNYKCIGCWKVYGDPESARVMFADIHKARSNVLRCFDEACTADIVHLPA